MFTTLIAAALQRAAPLPIDLELSVYRGAVVMVPMTVSGKRGRFIVGLTTDHTVVRSGFLDASVSTLPVSIEAGGQSLGSVRIQTTTNLPRIGADGIVGCDILRNYAIGFDREGRMRLWQGKTPSKDLESWLGPGARTVPLRTQDALAYLPVRAEGQEFFMLLTASSTRNTLTPPLADKLGFTSIADRTLSKPGDENTPVSEGVAGGFEAGGSEWPWLYASRTSPNPDPSYGGQLRVVDFNAGKVVVDLVQNQLVHIPAKGKSAIVSNLARMVNIPFEERDGKVWIGKRDIPGWEPFNGAQLLEYGGRPIDEWLKLQDRTAKERLQILSDLPQALVDNHLKLKLRDGRTVQAKLGS